MWVAYDVEDGPVGVAGVLVLCGVSNKALVVRKGHPRRCNTVTCRSHLSACVWCEDLVQNYLGR
jgi:hypothetical protein